ncbi:hypothetical protein QYF61_017250 [Mycteria americana]|uniref:ribonuclease H n=2 Tax=Mycteria americana TaxID=33587 RepID=A0AAN7RJJ8_MYCAM|nr:hypothetical protein QYF61_001230 [Mycteria americana]KAK4806627.1 hypothetical protein QYF61_017250 [Mycteria americana]
MDDVRIAAGCDMPLFWRKASERAEAGTGLETAWKAQICLLIEKDPNEEMNIPEEVLNVVTPLVWASKTPGQAKNATLGKTELKPGAQLECQSEFNTPILPVKKPHSSEYRLVQDLGEINARTVDAHPVVPNPYTLPTTIPNSNTYFIVLDLKDTFFCITEDEQSQTIFTFEWENPTTGRKTQLCWTVLPQGFKNSPTLFGKVLAKELELWQNDHDAVTLLQYVDDLLIGSDSYKVCLEAIISLLNFLGLAGYWVSKEKSSDSEIKGPIYGKHLRGFLGVAGWCCLWIPNFGLIAKPLYAAAKGPEGVLEWTPECRKSFDKIKRKLMEASALGLLNLKQPFRLYVHECQQVA